MLKPPVRAGTRVIDKNDEAEVLGIDQHVVVYFEAEAASKDAHKEHEGHAEAYALETQLSKHEPQGTDEADERDGLNGWQAEEHTVYPSYNVHAFFVFVGFRRNL